MFSKVVLIALLVVLGRFQQHVCPIAITVHILVFLCDSTQLGNMTENSVVRGAIAHHVFKGRFDCVVGCFTPFSISYMSNRTHCSHTHASWVIQPTYSIVLNTLWQREQLPARFSEVVLLVLFGVLGRVSTSFKSYHPVSSRTRDPWVNQPCYAIDLNILWQEKQLPAML